MLVEHFALGQFQQTRHQRIKRTWMDRIKFMISKIALDAGKKITVPVADVDPLNVPAELSMFGSSGPMSVKRLRRR